MERKNLHTFRSMDSLFFEARFVYDTPPGNEPKPKAAEVPKVGGEAEVHTETVIADSKRKTGAVKIGIESAVSLDKLKTQGGLPDAAKPEAKPEADPGAVGLHAHIPGGPIYAGFDTPGKASDAAEPGPSSEPKVAPLKSGECPQELPVKMTIDDFLSKPEYDLDAQKEKFEGWSVNIARRNYKYNPATWDHTTLPGLDRIYQECDRMGIIKQDPNFYNAAFVILRRAAAESNTYLGENKGEYVAMFKDPSSGHNHDTILALEATTTFDGGSAYIKAYDTVMKFLRKEILEKQINEQMATLKAQQDQGVDPIGTTVVDFAKSNLDTVQKAVKDRDYPTLAIYAAGGYALWQTLGKKLFGGSDGHGDAAHKESGFNLKDWLMWGGALYGANIMLKNAGYDVGKMVGFKNMDAEVKGTPLEAMRQILSMPKYNEQFKDLDYGIAMQMADTKLDSLQTLMLKTNIPGTNFIDPHMFPEQFEYLKDVSPFKMGLGEKGGYVGNDKLSGHQREYIRVGQQLYKLAFAMGKIYDETLKKNHPTFKNMSYEKALQDSKWAKSTVQDLMQEARRYVSVHDDEIYSSEKADDIKAKLLAGTNNVLRNNGFVMDDLELNGGTGHGHYGGKLKGFPIVVAVDKSGYRIYLRNNYGSDLGYNAAPRLADVTIPLSGDEMESEANKAVTMVDERMKELAEKFQNGNRDIGKPEFSGSSWQSKTSFKGAPNLGVDPNPDVPTPITVSLDGTKLTIDDGETGSGGYLERVVLGRLLDQKEFEALKVFGNANRLRVRDDVQDDHEFTLLVGKSGIPIGISCTVANTPTVTAKFNFKTPADEKALVKSPAFADEYLDAISSDPEFGFNKTIASFKLLIKDACPEKFLKHFFESLAGQTSGGNLFNTIADSVSGTVPDSFSNMMMDTVRNQTMFKLKNNMKSLDSLSAVDAEMKRIIGVANDDLKRLYNDVSAKNRDLKMNGKEWERTEFMLGVTDRIRSSGSESTQYKLERANMEALAYKMNLKGLGAGSDLNDESHLAAGKIIDIFTYYTAHLDSKEFLDNLKWPPRSSNASVPWDEDPNLCGHYRLRYFAYVKDRISNEIDKITDGGSLHPGNVPLPTDPRLGILDYQTWVTSTEARYDAIDPEDNSDPFTHFTVNHATDPAVHTPLDMEFQRKLIEAVENIKTHFGIDANITELDKYLDNSAKTDAAEEERGKFDIYKDPVSGSSTSKIWSDTDDIAQVAGSRRSVQIRLMDQKVDDFYNFILNARNENSGKLRFFVESEGFLEKLAKFYYRVRFNLNI